MSIVGIVNCENSTFNYKWTIDNFHHRLETPKTCLLSPVFATAHSNHAKKWRIGFYPHSNLREFAKYASIFLEYLSEGEITFSLELAIYLHDNYEKKHTRLKIKLSPQRAKYAVNNFAERSYTGFLGYENLTISCKITVDEPFNVLKTVHNSTSEVSDFEDYRLEKDLEKLFDAKTLSDVTVFVEDKKISLHKAILASRSEVFRAMFEHDMMKKEKNIVNIVDIRLKIAMEMFRYMYTGKLKNIENLDTEELFVAAEKYSVTGLQILCERTLYLLLNFDNALGYLTLACRHKTLNLKTQVIGFIVKNLHEFVDKPQFKSLDHSIMYDILTVVARNKNN